MLQNMPLLDGFAFSIQKPFRNYEGPCFLKTRSENFKEHWAVIRGNELYCYRSKDDKAHKVMHCLSGTHLKEEPDCQDVKSKKRYYPVKIVLPPSKSRVLFFESANE